jgi:hypothetical protein
MATSGIAIGPGWAIDNGWGIGGTAPTSIGALFFDSAVNPALGITNGPLGRTGTVNIEFWVNPNGGSNGSLLEWNTNAGLFTAGYTGSNLTVSPPGGSSMTAALNAGQWNYVCFGVYNGTGRLYVNGTNQGGSGDAIYTWDNNLLIGINTSGSNYFDGYLTNYRISNQDIYSLEAGPSTMPVPTAPLTATSNVTLLLLAVSGAGTAFDDTSGYNDTVVNSNVTYATVSPSPF